MEKEGLTRSLALLESCGINLDCIVTDRHPKVQKFLRERNITHYYDVWHMAKGILSAHIWSCFMSIISYKISFAPAFSILLIISDIFFFEKVPMLYVLLKHLVKRLTLKLRPYE